MTLSVEDVFYLIRRGVADEIVRKDMYTTTAVILQVCQGTLPAVVSDVRRLLDVATEAGHGGGLVDVLVIAGCPRSQVVDYFSRLEELLAWEEEEERRKKKGGAEMTMRPRDDDRGRRRRAYTNALLAFVCCSILLALFFSA